MIEGIHSRLGDLENSNSLILATFLDPRYRNIAFSNDGVTERVKNNITSLIISNIKKKNLSHSQEPPNTPPINKNETENGKSVNLLWRNFDKKVATLKPSGTAHSRAIIELQRYLEEPPISRAEDPLIWWKNNCYNFPFLSEIVKEKIVTVATSVPCERIFSKSDLRISERRSRLSSNKVEKLLFLNYNKDL